MLSIPKSVLPKLFPAEMAHLGDAIQAVSFFGSDYHRVCLRIVQE